MSWLTGLILLASAASTVLASVSYDLYDETKDSGHGLYHIYVDLQITNLRLVDARNSNFQVSGILYYAWRDDLMPGIPSSGKKNGRFYGTGTNQGTPPPAAQNGANSKPLFWPNHVWSNRLGSVAESNPLWVIRWAPPDWTGVSLDPAQSGQGTESSTEWWVTYQVEFVATYLQPQNLRDFPFDRQTVLMVLESRAHSDSTMIWEMAPSLTTDLIPLLGQPDGFNISKPVAFIDTAEYPKVGLKTSRLSVGLVLDRDPSFFVTSFVQPLSLTMCITILTIALMPVSQVGPRNGAATGGIGTTVSWVFVVSNMVPVLPYPTRLHSYLRFCFFMFAAIFVYNSWAYLMLDRFKTQVENARKSFKGRLACFCACCGICTIPGGEPAKVTSSDNKGDKDKDSVEKIGNKKDDDAVVTIEPTEKLLQYFLDKDAKEKEKADKEKAKKEFSVPTACLPGALSDYTSKMDVTFMFIFFTTYIIGTSLILRGPLPSVVIP